jgi:hypothetical protein
LAGCSAKKPVTKESEYFMMSIRGLVGWGCIGLAWISALNVSLAAVYPGNRDTSHGGEIGNGSLDLKDNGVTVTATLTRGGAPFDGDLVLFIDCVPGGFTSTSVFSDNSSELTRAISGVDASGTMRNIANFAPGFTADYAIAVGVNPGGAIYHLAQSGSGTILEYLGSAYFSPQDSQIFATYTFSFDWQKIGLPRSRTNFFKFESIYATQLGRRSTESFESLTGSGNWGSTLKFSNDDVYGVNPVPETTNTALVVFGGIIVIAGSAGSLRRVLKRFQNVI